ESVGLCTCTSGSASRDLRLFPTRRSSDLAFAVQSNVATGYGHFTIDAAGAWNYTLNDGNADVQGLNIGDTLTDTITVATADGTTHRNTTRLNSSHVGTAYTGTDSGTVDEA